MKKVKENYLPSNWEEKLRTDIMLMRMSRSMKFWDYVQNVRALNLILKGTTSHFDDASLRNILEADLEVSLRNAVYCQKINKVVGLKDWIEAVKAADEQVKDERKRCVEMLEDNWRP